MITTNPLIDVLSLEESEYNRYSLDILYQDPIEQDFCGIYWITGTNAVLPVFLAGGCKPDSDVELEELRFVGLMLAGQIAVLLDSEGCEHRVTYRNFCLEIDGVIYSKDEEITHRSVIAKRRLVRWE